MLIKLKFQRSYEKNSELLDQTLASFGTSSFKSAYCFRNSVAVVEEFEKKGYLINVKGVIVGKSWEAISWNPTQGPVAVLIGKKVKYLNQNGDVVFDSPSDPVTFNHPVLDGIYQFNFRHGIASFKKNDRWGAIDESGAIIISPQFDSTVNFQHRTYSIVFMGSKEGIIDRSGKYILNPSDEFISDLGSDFSPSNNVVRVGPRLYNVALRKFVSGNVGYWTGCRSGLCVIQESGGYRAKWKILDESGNLKASIPGVYDMIYEFGDGLVGFLVNSFSKTEKAKSYDDTRSGYLDSSGKVIIKAQFDWPPSIFECGIAKVSVSGRTGYVNKHGEYIRNPQ